MADTVANRGSVVEVERVSCRAGAVMMMKLKEKKPSCTSIYIAISENRQYAPARDRLNRYVGYIPFHPFSKLLSGTHQSQSPRHWE